MTNKKIAICLPAHNEELTIEATIRDFNRNLPNADIWVINNCSSDKTEFLASRLIRQLGCNGGVINERRKGKGNALRRFFLEVDADVYLLADADLTYPASRAYDLLAPIFINTADMVVGDRRSQGNYLAENKRPFHGFGNSLVCYLVNWLFRSNLKDIMSGYRAFSHSFAKSYPILVDGFEIETDMTIHALDKRFRILEIPIEYKDRPEGSESKLKTFSDGFRVLFIIAKIFRYYKPFMFFGSLSVIFMLLGLITSYPVFLDWHQFRYIYHVPLAILAVGLEIVACLLMTIALILDSIAYNNRRSFETELSLLNSSLKKNR